jgi:hypothetical protein
MLRNKTKLQHWLLLLLLLLLLSSLTSRSLPSDSQAELLPQPDQVPALLVLLLLRPLQ